MHLHLLNCQELLNDTYSEQTPTFHISFSTYLTHSSSQSPTISPPSLMFGLSRDLFSLTHPPRSLFPHSCSSSLAICLSRPSLAVSFFSPPSLALFVTHPSLAVSSLFFSLSELDHYAHYDLLVRIGPLCSHLGSHSLILRRPTRSSNFLKVL